MVGDLLVQVLGVALAVLVLVLVAVDMVRFRRQERAWKAQDEEFWRTMERWEPGIRERIKRMGREE